MITSMLDIEASLGNEGGTGGGVSSLSTGSGGADGPGRMLNVENEKKFRLFN